MKKDDFKLKKEHFKITCIYEDVKIIIQILILLVAGYAAINTIIIAQRQMAITYEIEKARCNILLTESCLKLYPDFYRIDYSIVNSGRTAARQLDFDIKQTDGDIFPFDELSLEERKKLLKSSENQDVVFEPNSETGYLSDYIYEKLEPDEKTLLEHLRNKGEVFVHFRLIYSDFYDSIRYCPLTVRIPISKKDSILPPRRLQVKYK